MTRDNPKPHVLIIAQYFPPDIAGTSTRAYNAAKGLRDQGCRITVLTAFPHYPHGRIPNKYRRKICSLEQLEGMTVLRTWVPSLSHYTYSRRIIIHASFIFSSLLGLFRIRDLDVIFCMNPNLFAFFSALFYSIIFRRKIIRNVDDLWPEVWYDLGIIKSRIFKRILDWTTKISYDIPVALTPLSMGYVPTLTDKYHIPREKIFVIEHGVDIDKFYPINSQSELTEKLETPMPPFRDHDLQKERTTTIAVPTEEHIVRQSALKPTTLIVYSGALSIGYDFKPVIEAAKILEQDSVHFILRGAGTSANDVENIRNMIERLKVRNVQVMTERLSSVELVEFLNKADIFILPMSFVDGFDRGLPTKTLEYQAVGKPIVCISNGESAEYIARTRSGLVCRSQDPAHIAKLIMDLVNNKDLARELGNNGHMFIQQNLTLLRIGERFMDIILKYSCKSEL